MPEPVALADTTLRQLEELGSVDLVVGVASCDHAGTIAGVLQAAWHGLEQAFPSARVALLHLDGGSRDGTLERAREALPGAPLVQLPYIMDRAQTLAPPGHGPPARATALRHIFELTRRLGARGCVVLEPDLTSITPEWSSRLLRPVMEGSADFVAPWYVRPRFGGAITSSILYPATRALYGRRIRFPAAGDFACATPLAVHYLAQNVWHSDLVRWGLDLWLTTQAVAAGFRPVQAALGVKTQSGPDGGTDLNTTLSRALGALFLDAEREAIVWQKIRGSVPVPLVDAAEPDAAEPVPVDRARLLDAFRLGQKNLGDIWHPVLPPLTLMELGKLARRPDPEFRLPDPLWVRIVYDFMTAYHARRMNRDHLLSAFTPLYLGWLGSFLGELGEAGPAAVEERVEQLCLRYETEKPYLISRWRWPDRFTP